MRKRIITICASAAVAAAVLAPVPAEAAPAIQIQRVWYDSPGSDRGSNASLNAEWVLIKNKGTTRRQLRGWKLKDRNGFTYTFGSFVLRPGKTVKVHTGQGRNTAGHRYWGRRWYVWNNTGDTAFLRRPNGTLVDRCVFDGDADSVWC